MTTCKETGEAELSCVVFIYDSMQMQKVSISDGYIQIWNKSLSIMIEDMKLIAELAIELEKGEEM